MVSQKAQAWGIDLMAAMTIFIVAITVFFVYSLNQSGEARSIIEDLNYDGKIFSNDLTSEGYPDDWVEANVVKILVNSSLFVAVYTSLCLGFIVRPKEVKGLFLKFYNNKI